MSMVKMTWGDLTQIKPSPEEDKMREQLLKWADRVLREEMARPALNAVAALHNQFKSQARPAQIHSGKTRKEV